MEGAVRLEWHDLRGWEADDQAAAGAALARCPNGPRVEGDPRAFFEAQYVPWLLPSGHFTGYFEPELEGARDQSEAFPVPIHTVPPMGIGASRAEIEDGDLLAGQEIAWLRDEVDRFFLQVQGSGRVRYPDGEVLRVTYAAKNGHPYQSIGRLLVDRGVFAAGEITADKLRDWLRADRARGVSLMRENPSYVMFRALHGTPPDEGPPGSLGCPLSQGRSLAVDEDVVPLGSPVWIEVNGPEGPIHRLCVAQDTGSAIKGVGRADLFYGTGAEAGRAAGALNHGGRMVVLLPA
jgi:membrane-bound lytic murein transglycosylase A